MSGERPNAIFNIRSQHGNISNVGGDMTVYGGQHYAALPRGHDPAGTRKYSPNCLGYEP
jgi:hypothetical protein